MRALLIDRVGDSDALRLADVPVPRPGPGDVLIRVACAGVNPADWKCREGYLGAFMQYTFPFVIGFDAAGIVEAVGAGVDGFAPGMRVFAQTDVGAGRWGAYAEYVAVRHDSVVRLPDDTSFAAAATVPTPALAAWAGLFDDGGLRAGQTVLIHGGAGAVGTFAIQLAAQAGARVVATCSARNRVTVEALGAAASIDYRAADIAQAVRAWAPGGVDLVLDAVGGDTLRDALDLLAPGGTLVNIMTLAAGDAERLATTAAEAARRGLRTAMTYSRMPSGDTLAKIARRLARHALRVPRFDRFPLEQAARALDLVQTGEAKAKLVLQVADIAG
ncbi:NADP-dependent oxidoreductase [Burkholderia pseudomultivorans]|uniref:Quinone oxidoreductase n=1 Tax=Burkholderia pseudomultivorans TaxID=1207504 RepID=A0A132ERS5_9BURK|nr:NADP-dependent oxidoreductase [Burkholderia pseudomultivorans]KWF57393.1 quinone oxidoreductase [Burkholderia pseudomultivorans]